MRFIVILLTLFFSLPSAASNPPPSGLETIPLSKTSFNVVTKNGIKKVDLKGKKVVVVSVREQGSDGRFYAVEKNGTVWKSGPVASGAKKYRSPSGIFTIFQKKRYHMSTVYPDESGVNNMDYMMKFTRNGHALHKGSVEWMSHGCIHVDPKDVVDLYKWTDFSTRVVVTRHSYMPFAQEDLRKIYKVDKASIFNFFDFLFSSE